MLDFCSAGALFLRICFAACPQRRSLASCAFSFSGRDRRGFVLTVSCRVSSFFSLAFSFFLKISSWPRWILRIHVVGDDVVPVGEEGVQLADPLLPVGDLLFVLLLFPLVLLLDPFAFGVLGLLRLRPFSPRPSCRPVSCPAGFFSASFLGWGEAARVAAWRSRRG